MKSPITTHVLDTMSGKPAAGMKAALEMETGPYQWKEIGHGATDADGRLNDLLPESHRLAVGNYRVTFDTGAYFEDGGIKAFYPWVTVTFTVSENKSHYHIPLLLSRFGYSTYRGS
jgi:5-hydroxyisourate hydrolase